MTALQFIGPFFFYQAMIGAMDQGGSIIQMSSATATIMLNDHAAYMGAKAGADHVIRCVANEFGARGIRANSISPGLTDTPMTAGAKQTPGVWDAFLPCYPAGRIGTSGRYRRDGRMAGRRRMLRDRPEPAGNGGLTLRRNPTRDEINASVMAAMSRG